MDAFKQKSLKQKTALKWMKDGARAFVMHVGSSECTSPSPTINLAGMEMITPDNNTSLADAWLG